MLIQGQPHRTVWRPLDAPDVVRIIDQTALPWQVLMVDLRTVDEVARAIRDMLVRGAGCIGATAAYGMALAAHTGVPLASAAAQLKATRPTAVNLAWAVDRMLAAGATWDEAERLANEDAAMCRAIGQHGLRLFQKMLDGKPSGHCLNVLTHCNAGWLAFVDYGSATAPIYAAHDLGWPIHVWVDETRPRLQGARLTAWELASHGVRHTVIADNAGGHLMQRGLVDMVITGADRVTRTGDVANKIGTYLKALAATDTGVPFYVALPSSTFDWTLTDGLAGIPIEERSEDEMRYGQGPLRVSDHRLAEVEIIPRGSACGNPAFDVTPSRLITGLITERGVCAATASGILGLYPEQG